MPFNSSEVTLNNEAALGHRILEQERDYTHSQFDKDIYDPDFDKFVSITPEERENARSNNMSTLDMLANGFMTLSGYIIGSLAKGLGYASQEIIDRNIDRPARVLDAVHKATLEGKSEKEIEEIENQAANDETNFVEKLKTNPLYAFGTDAINFAESEFPIYHTTAYKNASPWTKWATHPTQFWSDSGAKMLGFMTSAFIQAEAMNKAGVAKAADAVVSELLETSGLAKVLPKIKSVSDKILLSNKITKTSKKILQELFPATTPGAFAISYLNSKSEAMIEGMDAYDTQYTARKQELIDKLGHPPTEEELSEIDKQAKSFAYSSFKNTMDWNTGILTLSNLWETKMFLGNSIGKNLIKGLGKEEIESLTMKPLTFGKKLLEGGKEALVGAFDEGMGENAQLAVQNYQTKLRKGEVGDSLSDQFTEILKGMGQNFTTDEGAENIVGGMLMGILAGGFGGFKNSAEQWKYQNEKLEDLKKNYNSSQLSKDFKILEKTSISRNPDDTFTVKDENGNVVLNENGKPEIDIPGVVNYLHSLGVQASGDTLANALKSMQSDELSQHIRNTLFNEVLYTHVSSGFEDILKSKLDLVKEEIENNPNLTPEEKRSAIQNLDNHLSKIDKGVSLFRSINNKYGGHLIYKRNNQGEIEKDAKGKPLTERLYDIKGIFTENLLNESLRDTRNSLINTINNLTNTVLQKYEKEIAENAEKNPNESPIDFLEESFASDPSVQEIERKTKQLEFVNDEIKNSDNHLKDLTAGKQEKIKNIRQKLSDAIKFQSLTDGILSIQNEISKNGGKLLFDNQIGDLSKDSEGNLVFIPDNKNFEPSQITKDNISKIVPLENKDHVDNFYKLQEWKIKAEEASKVHDEKREEANAIIQKLKEAEQKILEMEKEIQETSDKLKRVRKAANKKSLKEKLNILKTARDSYLKVVDKLQNQLTEIQDDLKILESFIADRSVSAEGVANRVALELTDLVPELKNNNKVTRADLFAHAKQIIKTIQDIIQNLTEIEIPSLERAISRIENLMRVNPKFRIYDMLVQISASTKFNLPENPDKEWLLKFLMAYDSGGKFAGITPKYQLRGYEEDMEILRHMLMSGADVRLSYEDYHNILLQKEKELQAELEHQKENLFNANHIEKIFKYADSLTKKINEAIEKIYKRKAKEYGESSDDDLPPDFPGDREHTEEDENRQFILRKTSIWVTAGNQESKDKGAVNWYNTLDDIKRKGPFLRGQYTLKVIRREDLPKEDVDKYYHEGEIQHEEEVRNAEQEQENLIREKQKTTTLSKEEEDFLNGGGRTVFIKVVLCKIVKGVPVPVMTDNDGHLKESGGTRYATTTLQEPIFKNKFAYDKIGIEYAAPLLSQPLTFEDIDNVSPETPIVLEGLTITSKEEWTNWVINKIKNDLAKFRISVNETLNTGTPVYLDVLKMSRGVLNFSKTPVPLSESGVINKNLSNVVSVSISSGSVNNIVSHEEEEIAKGSIVIQTREGNIIPVIPAFLEDQDINVILKLLAHLNESKDGLIKDSKGNDQRILPDFKLGDEINKPSLLMRLMRWGKDTNHPERSITIKYINGVRSVVFGKENFSVPLQDVLDTSKNGNLVEFLKNKVFQINRSMLHQNNQYDHPINVVNGVVEYKTYTPDKRDIGNNRKVTMGGYEKMVLEKVKTRVVKPENGPLYLNRYLTFDKSGKKYDEVPSSQEEPLPQPTPQPFTLALPTTSSGEEDTTTTDEITQKKADIERRRKEKLNKVYSILEADNSLQNLSDILKSYDIHNEFNFITELFKNNNVKVSFDGKHAGGLPRFASMDTGVINGKLSNILTINKSRFDRLSKKEKLEVIAHELVHGLIKIKLNEKGDLKGTSFYKGLNEIFKEVKDFYYSGEKQTNKANFDFLRKNFTEKELNDLGGKIRYIESSIEEFATLGLTDPTVSKFLKLLKGKGETKQKNLWTKLAEVISDFLGISNTKFNELLNFISEELNTNINYTDKINTKHDAEYVDKVRKGEFTAQQAKDALKEINRLTPKLSKQIDDAELVALKAEPSVSGEEKMGTTIVDTSNVIVDDDNPFDYGEDPDVSQDPSSTDPNPC